MTDLTKKFTSENDDINTSDAEQIVKTIQSAVLQDELNDSVDIGKVYSITGDLTSDTLTNDSPTKSTLTEGPHILENSK